MAINFGPDRWDALRETYERFWCGDLGRPVAGVWIRNRVPDRPVPEAPLLSQSTCADLTTPVTDVIDRVDYELERYEFLGDAFPFLNLMSFGPGVAAAFCGAKLDNSSGQVWFFPKKRLPIEEIHLEYDPQNVWLRRIEAIIVEGMRRWRGQVLIGMPDLGGGLDMAATFRTTEDLLMDLHDSPREVKRLVGEVHEVWHRFYRQLCEVMGSGNPGYADWSGIFSDRPNYMLQSDFSYMISPTMFDEFTKPELAASAGRLGRAMYHLDGPGQLPHVDSVLSIDGIDLVQWVPGDGVPDASHWPDLYRRVIGAGKKTQVIGGLKCVATVVDQVGSPEGVTGLTEALDASQYKRAVDELSALGVPLHGGSA